MRLLLIPTAFERSRLPDTFERQLPADVHVEIVGFGPIVSAARTAELVARHGPLDVTLLGIAGAYGERLELGLAYQFSEVSCDGVGVGVGDDFRRSEDMGWKQWTGWDSERLPLATSEADIPDGALLVTVCAASNSLLEAESRRARHDSAGGEDMEGFGVLAACKLAGVPCRIIRGISNQAGIRDKSAWRIDEALNSAADAVLGLLNHPES